MQFFFTMMRNVKKTPTLSNFKYLTTGSEELFPTCPEIMFRIRLNVTEIVLIFYVI